MSRALRPLFVAVTWGAGGSTSAKSLELAEICQRQLGITTCLHLTCTNMSRRLIDEALEEAKALGVRNILALRGDPPREEEYRIDGEDESQEEDSNGGFTWAIDLVRYIRRIHGNYFCIGVATYPEGHADESYPTEQDPKHDLPYLIDKTKAGADFIMTQLFYDEGAYVKFEKMLREHESGVFKDIPILPGLMPIQSYQILKRTTKLSHAKLPPELLERLEPVKGDDEAVKMVGVDVISEIVEDIKKIKSPGPRGFHFFTLNLEKAVGFILERCHLIPPHSPEIEGLDLLAIDNSISNGVTKSISTVNHTTNLNSHRRVSSSTTSHNYLTTDNLHTPNHTSAIDDSPPSRATDLAISHGVGSLGREATWDDYPNGRFGDARSPAFNPPTSYSTSLPLSPFQARILWGTPTTLNDITTLFRRHLSGSLPVLPWSDSSGLSPETALITPQLTRLIDQRTWWTIASQPAADGVPSSDPILGWGPPGGFVFQKAFVELFLPASDWHNILRPHLESASVRGEVSWYAGDCDGAYESSDGADAVNAVTWGAFAGKEIVTATIVEEVSFRAWVEEAFGLWVEWGRCYGGEGEGRKKAREFLKWLRGEVWLVNVICHGYREGDRLWDVLMEA